MLREEIISVSNNADGSVNTILTKPDGHNRYNLYSLDFVVHVIEQEKGEFYVRWGNSVEKKIVVEYNDQGKKFITTDISETGVNYVLEKPSLTIFGINMILHAN